MKFSYLKILFAGVLSAHILIAAILLSSAGIVNDQTNLFQYVMGFLTVYGVLSTFATVYETFLEEGFASGFLSFIALAFPIVGSYFLFSFLVREIKKENETYRKRM